MLTKYRRTTLHAPLLVSKAHVHRHGSVDRVCNLTAARLTLIPIAIGGGPSYFTVQTPLLMFTTCARHQYPRYT